MSNIRPVSHHQSSAYPTQQSFPSRQALPPPPTAPNAHVGQPQQGNLAKSANHGQFIGKSDRDPGRQQGGVKDVGDEGSEAPKFRMNPNTRSKTTHTAYKSNVHKFGFDGVPSKTQSQGWKQPQTFENAFLHSTLGDNTTQASDLIGNASRQAAQRRIQPDTTQPNAAPPPSTETFNFSRAKPVVRGFSTADQERGEIFSSNKNVPATGGRVTRPGNELDHAPNETRLNQTRRSVHSYPNETSQAPHQPPVQRYVNDHYDQPLPIDIQYRDDQPADYPYSPEQQQGLPLYEKSDMDIDGEDYLYDTQLVDAAAQEADSAYLHESLQPTQLKPAIVTYKEEHRDVKPNVEQLTGSIVTIQVELKQRIAELEMSNNQFEVQNSQLLEDARTATDERLKMQKRLDTAAKRVEEANKVVHDQSKKAQVFRVKVIDMMNKERAECARLQQLLESRPANDVPGVNDLREEIQKQLEEIKALSQPEGQLSELKGKLESLGKELDQKQDLTNSIKEHKATVSRLNRELDEKRKDLIHERERTQEVEARVKDLANSFKAFQDDVASKNASTQINTEKLRQEHIEAERALSEARNEIKHLNESIDTKAAIIATQEERLVHYESKLKAMGCSLDELDELMNSDDEEVEKVLRKSSSKREQEVADWNKRLELASGEIARLSDRLKESESKLTQAKDDVKEKQRSLSNADKIAGTMQCTIDQLEAQVVQLKEDLKAQKAEGVAKTEQLSQAEKREAVAVASAGERLLAVNEAKTALTKSETALNAERAEVKRLSDLLQESQVGEFAGLTYKADMIRQRLLEEANSAAKALAMTNKSPAKTPAATQAEIGKIKQALEFAQKAKSSAEKTVESQVREVNNLKLTIGKLQDELSALKNKSSEDTALVEELEATRERAAKAEEDLVRLKTEMAPASLLQRWNAKQETEDELSMWRAVRSEIRGEEQKSLLREMVELKNELKRTKTQLNTARTSKEEIIKKMDEVHIELNQLKARLKKQEHAANLASNKVKGPITFGGSQSKRKFEIDYEDEDDSLSDLEPSPIKSPVKKSMRSSDSSRDLESTLDVSQPTATASAEPSTQRKTLKGVPSLAESRRTRSTSSVAPSQAMSIDMPVATQNPAKKKGKMAKK